MYVIFEFLEQFSVRCICYFSRRCGLFWDKAQNMLIEVGGDWDIYWKMLVTLFKLFAYLQSTWFWAYSAFWFKMSKMDLWFRRYGHQKCSFIGTSFIILFFKSFVFVCVDPLHDHNTMCVGVCGGHWGVCVFIFGLFLFCFVCFCLLVLFCFVCSLYFRISFIQGVHEWLVLCFRKILQIKVNIVNNHNIFSTMLGI